MSGPQEPLETGTAGVLDIEWIPHGSDPECCLEQHRWMSRHSIESRDMAMSVPAEYLALLPKLWHYSRVDDVAMYFDRQAGPLEMLGQLVRSPEDTWA